MFSAGPTAKYRSFAKTLDFSLIGIAIYDLPTIGWSLDWIEWDPTMTSQWTTQKTWRSWDQGSTTKQIRLSPLVFRLGQTFHCLSNISTGTATLMVEMMELSVF